MTRWISMLVALTALLHASTAVAGKLIQFDAVSFDQAPAKKLLGYLAKPEGVGPFPAVIVLHGCTGFFSGMSYIADRLMSWGYVALAIDSLGPCRRLLTPTPPVDSRVVF